MRNPTTRQQMALLRSVSLLFLLLLLLPPLFAQQIGSFDEAIEMGDRYYKQKKYLDAKAYYQMALKYKAGDSYAKSQISAIVELLKAGMEKEDEYFDIVDLADVFYEEGAYDKALTQYRKALEVVPGDEYANKKIADILRVKNEEKERIASYNKAMEKGEKLMAEKNYPEAIKAFGQARIIYPERSTPTEKIETARQLETEYESKLVTYKEETEAAGRYLLVKDYATALEHYQNAQNLFPEDEKIAQKIEEIRPQAEKQQQYNEVVGAADELYISKDFTAAEEKYREAGKLWPENSYPVDMISKIEDQLALQRKDLENNYRRSVERADSLLGLNLYTEARAEYNLALTLKPAEKYPKAKLEEIKAYFAEQQKAFEADYAQKVAEADRFFKDGEYERAKSLYQTALETKPDDSYPKDQLAAIEDIFRQQAEQERKDTAYNSLIAEADRLFENGHYDLAISKYEEAKTLKATDDYPEGKIGEIRQILADAQKQKETDEAFGKQMVLAIRLFNEGQLEAAKQAYENARELKPYDLQPKVQIARIDSITRARIQQAEIEKASAALIAKGDSLRDAKAYDAAILAFEQALEVKPKDPVAAQRLSKTKIIKRNYEKAIAKQKAFDDAVAEADGYFDSKNYELAKTAYEKAIELKSNEAYPKQRLGETVHILKRLALEQQKRFNEAIVKGDNFYEQENYQEAVLQYKVAESIKPAERYPKERIAECNSLLAEQLKVLKAQYDLSIADADKLYATKIYDKAIKAYQNAERIKPDEDYPREQITKITRLIEKNAITDVVTDTITINSQSTERFAFSPLPINVRKSNYILIKARNLSGKSFKIIFTYGSTKGKNGGFVVQVPEGEGYNDYIIRVGNQYKWFSDDNDWLTIYPENGNIEISMVRISKSD